jgi:hypothetical protein
MWKWGCLSVVALTGFSSAAPPAFHDLVAGDGPVLWYQFGEPFGASSVVNTGSLGSMFDADIFGTVTLGVASSGGDTAAGFVRTGSPFLQSQSNAPTSMQGNPTFTAEAVVYIPSTGTSSLWAPVLHWGSGGTGTEVYFSLQQNRNNVFYVGFYNGGLRTVSPFDLDQWNHFVWVRDSGGGVNNAFTGSTLYVNGEPVSLEVDTNLIGFAGPPSVGPGPFRVQRGADFTRFFDGTLDEVILYDRVLTAEEVEAHFDALDLAPCEVDFAPPFDVLNFFDVLTFLQLFTEHDLAADLTHDGVFDFFDVLTFLQVFAAGCA